MGVVKYSTAVSLALLFLHVYLGLMIFTHGYRKVFKGGKIPGTARWFDSIGMKPGRINAYAAATTELGVGVLLTFGLLTQFASAGLIAVMLVAIVSVHRNNGFMITNPGGGIEYCLGIVVMALVQGTFGSGKYSLDHEWGVLANVSEMSKLLITLTVGVVGALIQLTMFYRPTKNT